MASAIEPSLRQATPEWRPRRSGRTTFTAAGGLVATSPALSLDGTKVAFVETGSGTAHFHVLAWKSGDGVAAIFQSVTSPVKPVRSPAALPR